MQHTTHMKHIEDVLGEHSFFADLPPATRSLIAGCGVNARHAAGEMIAREGDPADTFFAIRHGRVAVRLTPPAGPPLTLATLEDSEILGWSWLVPPYRWQYDATALTDTATIRFDGACLRQKCEADPALGYELMKRFASLFARRLSSARIQLMDLHAPARDD